MEMHCKLNKLLLLLFFLFHFLLEEKSWEKYSLNPRFEDKTKVNTLQNILL